MNNLTKEKKQQLVLIVMLTVAILSGLWFGLVSAQQTARRRANQKLQDVTARVDKAEKLARRKGQIADELAAFESELQDRERDMAGADPFLWFVTLMNQYVSTPSRGLQNFQTGSISQPDEVGLLPKFPYKAITFSVQMQGAYQDFGQFVADFENDWPYLRVQNVNLRPAGGASVATGTTSATGEKLDITFEVVALTLTNRANIK